MDLRFHGPEPTADERAAVDSVLGPPASAWAGGPRNVEARATLAAGRPRGPSPAATSFCPPSTPSSRGSAGLRPAPSTTSAGA